MKNLLVVVALLVSTSLVAQNRWESGKTGNPFDGEFKYAGVQGTGSEYPYNDPLLVINTVSGKPALYISGGGYSGYDNMKASVAFDGSDEILYYQLTSNTEEDSFFFVFEEDIDRERLFKKMQLKNKMHIRVNTDGGKSDFVFPLANATKSINYILYD